MAELIRGAGDGTTFKARDPEALRTALRRYLTATPARPPAPAGARVTTLEACADEHERIYLSLSSSQVRRTPGGKGGMDA
jgi:hypothetical protein